MLTAGTYTETLTIEKDGIKIKGAGSNSTTLDGGGVDQAVILVKEVKNITIEGLTVQNGSDGICALDGASVTVQNSIFKNNSDDGFDIQNNCNARLSGCSSTSNTDHGIAAYHGCSLILEGTTSSNSNGDCGIMIYSGSNAFFSSGTVTANSNVNRGIFISSSSSLSLFDCNINVESNQNDGISVVSSSSFWQSGTGILVSKSNARRGIALADTSSMLLQSGSDTKLQNNRIAGLQVAENSSAELYGILLADANGNEGILVNISSTLGLGSGGSITVQETTGEGIGIYVGEASSFFAFGGTLIVQNNKIPENSDQHVDYGVGILVCRSSSLRLQGSGLAAQITANEGHGISAYQGCSIRLDSGVKINQNSKNGLNIAQQSVLFGRAIEVKNNSGWGVKGDDGSSIGCENSTITDNSSGAVQLSFGAKSTLNGNTISPTPITCDSTVLSRGDCVCP